MVFILITIYCVKSVCKWYVIICVFKSCTSDEKELIPNGTCKVYCIVFYYYYYYYCYCCCYYYYYCYYYYFLLICAVWCTAFKRCTCIVLSRAGNVVAYRAAY